MVTIGEKLAARSGIGPGFDVLRLTLAVGIVAWHTDALLSGEGTLDHGWLVWFPGYAILTMFFALSGFLIAGSAGRLSLGDFLINRGLRIVPALTIEVVFSAFLLGPAFSSLPLREYFSSALTFHYLTNVVGLMNYRLPQVFAQHPNLFVNLSLWTVPYEYCCYALISVIILLGLLRRPLILATGVASLFAIGLVATTAPDAWSRNGSLVDSVVDHVFSGYQSRLFTSFLLGILVFVLRGKLPYSGACAGFAALVCTILAFLGPADRIGLPVINVIACPALVYLTVYIGVSDVPTLPLFRRGDYSYGIYLYGFPIQQAMFDLFPVPNPAFQFLLALPVISLFAALSWHCIERPVLRIRRHFSFTSKLRSVQDHKGPAKALDEPAEGSTVHAA